MASYDDFFTTGQRAVSFADGQMGKWKGGEIVSEPSKQQQRDDDGEPKTWKDGNPIMMVVVQVKADGEFVADTLWHRDGPQEDEDGVRGLYIDSLNKRKAVAQALKDAKAPGLRMGGRLYLKGTGQDKPVGTKSGTKHYAAKYIPPALGVSEDNANPFSSVASDDPFSQSHTTTKDEPVETRPAPPAGPLASILNRVKVADSLAECQRLGKLWIEKFGTPPRELLDAVAKRKDELNRPAPSDDPFADNGSEEDPFA